MLDNDCIVTVVQENNLENAIKNLKVKPKLVVTDSQAFKAVDSIVPEDINIHPLELRVCSLNDEISLDELYVVLLNNLISI